MMQQKSVSGAQLRGAKYHFNTPIPVDIRHLYPKHKSGTYRGSMYTRDPDEAERQVRSLRAEFDRHVNTEKRKADQARLANLLDPDQRGLLNELGGWSGLGVVRSKRSKIAKCVTVGWILVSRAEKIAQENGSACRDTKRAT